MVKKLKIIVPVSFLLAGFLIFLFLSPFNIRSSYDPEFILRVRIASGVKTVPVSSEEKVDIVDPLSGKNICSGLVLAEGSVIMLHGDGMILGGRTFSHQRIRILNLPDSVIEVNGIEYRGSLDLLLTDQGIDILNIVELEDYLKGVVPKEAYNFWPMTALKAQAIAARSYAVHEALRRRSGDFDLRADVSSQVYGGRSAEKGRSSKAVETTRGMVLEYGGKIFPAYYHSSCGGHTEEVSLVWGGEPMEPLKGVSARWCRWTPHFRWRARVFTSTIKEKLNAAGYYLDSIDDIREGDRSSSKRLKYVRVRSRNKWLDIPSNDFLNAIGRRTLKSSNFRIKKYPLFYLFSGYGWGHGVGMCQWCSFGLSLRLWREERILRYFYPGTRIVDLSEILGLSGTV